MKSNFLTLTFFVAAIATTFFLTSAKSNTTKSKLGYINTTALWQVMPDKALADTSLVKMKREFIGYLQQKQKNFENGVAIYKRDSINMSNLIKKEKIDELLKAQEEIKTFPKRADAELNKKKEELYTPIRQKMQKAIDEVAKENNFDYITDVSFGNIIYAKNTQDNILELVKNKLGLK